MTFDAKEDRQKLISKLRRQVRLNSKVKSKCRNRRYQSVYQITHEAFTCAHSSFYVMKSGIFVKTMSYKWTVWHGSWGKMVLCDEMRWLLRSATALMRLEMRLGITENYCRGHTVITGKWKCATGPKISWKTDDIRYVLTIFKMWSYLLMSLVTLWRKQQTS